jgi:nucleoside-diphosphate-sugar epimerase
MHEPWVDEGFVASDDRPPQPAGRRKRVLVTGAGGFLGSRTVELLKERYGYDVLAVVKEPKSAARLARWPIEIALGDVCSASNMDRLVPHCDAVVHCAVGTSWMPQEVRRVTVEGTRTVAEAALKAGVKRFVHISSMAVHQPDASNVWDETVPLEPRQGDSYGHNKLEAEKAVQRVASTGLSAIILRPARIYGPFSKTFTVRPLQALTEGRLALSGDPEVPANMVYVDNVVEAIARAIEADDSRSNQAYLINDPDQLSMRAFFEYFGQTSGASVRVVPQLPASPLKARGVFSSWVAGLRTIALSPEVRALVHRVLETDPVGTLPRRLWESSPNVQRKLLKLFRVDAAVVYRPPSPAGSNDLVYYGGPAVVSSAKAERELEFHPIVPRERAMALTLEWAQQARLVPFK